MSSAIFRVQGIKTTNDLRGIGKHNDERISATNDDIDLTLSGENIHLIPSKSKSYSKDFFKMVEPMKQEHDEKMKTERKDRVKSFEAKINSSKNDVACEFLFTSDKEFFEGKSKDEIKNWAQQSLNFVKDEIGIDEKNILHAIIHMDEKTPHLHVVAVPLVNKYDGRAKKDVWQINRKHFIETKIDMSILQDKYYELMQNEGHDLERGVKGSKLRHLTVEEYKIDSRRKESQLLQYDIDGLKSAVVSAKGVDDIKVIPPSILDRKHVKIPIEDFDELKTKAKATEALQLESLGNLELALQHEDQATSWKKKYQSADDKNKRLTREINELKSENQTLRETITSKDNMIKYLENTLELIKKNSSQLLNVAIDKMQMYVGRVRGHVLFNQFGQKAYEEGELQQHIPMDERKSADDQIAASVRAKEKQDEKAREYERELLRKAALKEKAIKAHDERIKEKEREERKEMEFQKEIEKPVKTKERDDFEIGG
jgi:hypothetical protein